MAGKVAGKEQQVMIGASYNSPPKARYMAKSIPRNEMFLSPTDKLIMPGIRIKRVDGSEKKRNRTPSNKDRMSIRLAHNGIIITILLVSAHFVVSYPYSCLLQGCTI